MGACTSKRNNLSTSELISPHVILQPQPTPTFPIKPQYNPSQSIIVSRESFYSSLINTIDICVIGNNEQGELGLGHLDHVKYLTVLNSIPHQTVSDDDSAIHKINIHSGYKFTIYSNISEEHEHWAAGANYHGECCFNISKDATKCNAIQWFKTHEISIKKICLSIGGQAVFWITDNNRVLANGGNEYGQLGIHEHKKSWKPQIVPFFDGFNVSNVKDIQCAKNYSIALCTTDYNHIITIIIKHLAMEIVHQILPKDILDLIVLFYRINNVYSTEFSKYGGNGHEFIHRWDKYGQMRTNWGWKEILTLKDRDFIKIRTGRNHTLFLDTFGVVWACGINVNGGLGLGHCNDVYEPEMIQWFVDNHVKIVDIKCGSDHNLCLDEDGKVYSFGANHYGQCGDSSTVHLSLPKMVKYFKGRKVLRIDCGSNHSYCLVEKECTAERDSHYLFGSNKVC